jgi:hypothetical protein
MVSQVCFFIPHVWHQQARGPVAMQAEQLEWKRKGSVVSSAQQVAGCRLQHAARSMELGGTPPTVAVAVTVTRDARKLRVKQKWAVLRPHGNLQLPIDVRPREIHLPRPLR